MSISDQAKEVIQRPLDPSRVKQRQGGHGMTFDYIGTEHAIQLLNEAFDYAWDTTIIKHEIFDGLAVALVELKVWDSQGSPIVKQQFGSCNINKGVDTGAALKGAASDGLKKCASQLGVALELYLDDVPAPFTPPTRRPSTTAASKPSPLPLAPPPRPTPPSRPPAPADPPAQPFAGGPPRPTVPAPAAVQRPSPPAPPQAVQRPAPPPRPPAAVAASTSSERPNPFEDPNSKKGITSTQKGALESLAEKRGKNQPDMIQLAPGIVDDLGAPKQVFEELTHAEAIKVIRAASNL